MAKTKSKSQSPSKTKSQSPSKTKTKSQSKTQSDESDVEPETSVEIDSAESKPGARSHTLDPWDRWGDFAWRPSWFGLRWPDRLLGEVGGLFDHIKIEEYAEDDSLVVRAEIPGVDPDNDVDISVENHRLCIRAERKASREDDTDGYRSEFHYGSVSRIVSLPDGADIDGIEAEYRDGILEVTVPLTAENDRAVKKVSIGRR